MTNDFDRAEALARQLLKQPERIAIRLRSGDTPTACLMQISDSSPVCLPLHDRVTYVGRGSPADFADSSRRTLAGVVEGAQWKIDRTCEPATVQDAASTNGSILVPRGARNRAPDNLLSFHGDCGYWLGWDGSTSHTEPRPLQDGDILVNAYTSFVYCSP